MPVKKEKCNHLVGYAEGVDEGWLCYVDTSDSAKEYIEVYFYYCPLCGEKLKETI